MLPAVLLVENAIVPLAELITVELLCTHAIPLDETRLQAAADASADVKIKRHSASMSAAVFILEMGKR
jgi:hypothetical protein